MHRGLDRVERARHVARDILLVVRAMDACATWRGAQSRSVSSMSESRRSIWRTLRRAAAPL